MAEKKGSEIDLDNAKDAVKELVKHTITEMRDAAGGKKVKGGRGSIDYYPYGINEISFSITVQNILEFSVDVVGPGSEEGLLVSAE
jgi:hypothetical protein